MSKSTAPKGFDFDSALSADTADLVLDDGNGGEWRITFAGPGHEVSVKIANEAHRKRIREERERQRLGNRYREEERTPEQDRRKNVEFVVDRILSWSGLIVGGKEMPFERQAAIALLEKPAAGIVYARMLEFLVSEDSFTKRSAAI